MTVWIDLQNSSTIYLFKSSFICIKTIIIVEKVLLRKSSKQNGKNEDIVYSADGAVLEPNFQYVY